MVDEQLAEGGLRALLAPNFRGLVGAFAPLLRRLDALLQKRQLLDGDDELPGVANQALGVLQRGERRGGAAAGELFALEAHLRLLHPLSRLGRRGGELVVPLHSRGNRLRLLHRALHVVQRVERPGRRLLEQRRRALLPRLAARHVGAKAFEKTSLEIRDVILVHRGFGRGLAARRALPRLGTLPRGGRVRLAATAAGSRPLDDGRAARHYRANLRQLRGFGFPRGDAFRGIRPLAHANSLRQRVHLLRSHLQRATPLEKFREAFDLRVRLVRLLRLLHPVPRREHSLLELVHLVAAGREFETLPQEFLGGVEGPLGGGGRRQKRRTSRRPRRRLLARRVQG